MIPSATRRWGYEPRRETGILWRVSTVPGPRGSIELRSPSTLGHGYRYCGWCHWVAEQALHLAVVLRRPGERLHDVVNGAQRFVALLG
jgi:hypothetical protein